MRLLRIIELAALLGLLAGAHSAEQNESVLKEADPDERHMDSVVEATLEQYQSMYLHQGRRGGKGRWSNGISGLPSPRIAKKHVVSLVRGDPEKKQFGSISLKSYVRSCIDLVNHFPRIHHGVGGGILVAIHSYQEEEHTIVRGFCTEAGMMYFFGKEMEGLIRESSKPNSLIPALSRSLFDQYDAGGNWDDFVENCEDLIKEHRRRVLRRESASKWSAVGHSEISDFCEEVSDDIYPNYLQSQREWAHIYALQNHIVERKGEMGAPILGIPREKPDYYVAGRHQSSMYRKCLRALWDMFQYDDQVDMKIAGRNQYETLRSFCDAAKRFYTRGGRVSSSPMINIGDPPRKRRHSPDSREEGLVEQILEKQRDKELRERLLTARMRRKLAKQQEERIKRQRAARKRARESESESDSHPGASEFPLKGVFSSVELPSPEDPSQAPRNVFQELPEPSLLEPVLPPVAEGPSDPHQETDEFGLDVANEEFEQLE